MNLTKKRWRERLLLELKNGRIIMSTVLWAVITIAGIVMRK